jgi:hypothetical protein
MTACIGRRDFITLLGGAAATLLKTLAASAQDPGRTYRLGGLSNEPLTAPHYVANAREPGRLLSQRRFHVSRVISQTSPCGRQSKRALPFNCPIIRSTTRAPKP